MKKFVVSFFIIATIICMSSVFASEEDIIRQKLNNGIATIQNNIDNNFRANYYVIIASGSTSPYDNYRIYLSENPITAYWGTHNGGPNDSIFIRMNSGYKITLVFNGRVEINSGNIQEGPSGTMHFLYAKDNENAPETNVLNDYFFMEAEAQPEVETPVETSGEQQAEIITISGELPVIVEQLQEMSAEKMQLGQTITTIVLVGISCLVLLISCIILCKVLRIFL